MNDFTENDAKQIQASLLRDGYELLGAMADPAEFTTVLNEMFYRLKQELIESPGELLFTPVTGNYMDAYEKAEEAVARFNKQKKGVQ
jgi:hypothetical protein